MKDIRENISKYGNKEEDLTSYLSEYLLKEVVPDLVELRISLMKSLSLNRSDLQNNAGGG